ncbi:MAG: cbb3-type cytochrome c oxidase subunit I [Rhodospirillales bacterium]|nr:cbb3-type cytochrome c oxidase subunit I [Rhodospirillales bacterium]
MQPSPARRELKSWCILALSSLGLAGIFAFLLAFSRVPNVQDIFPWPLQFFQKGLVIHVVFSFVVWFLSLLGGLLTIATYRISNSNPRGRLLGTLSLWLAYVAFVLLFIPGLMDRGEPSLNNYVPVIIDPLYYTGLCLFASSLALQCIRLLINTPAHQGPFDPVTKGIAVAGILYLAALLCFGISLELRWGSALDAGFNEDVFWAGGHVLQFLNTLLMVIAWYIVGGTAISRPLIDPRIFLAIVGLFIIAAVALVSLSLLFDPTSFDGRQAYTWAQYGMAPPTLAFVGAAAVNLYLHRQQSGAFDWRDPALLSLFLSVAVFGIGGVLGLFVDGADTRTPAHYHGVIGGVNIAFIGLFFCFLFPVLNAPIRSIRSVRILLWSYALGQTLHSLGLFLAGGYGAPRKTAGDAQGMEALGAEIGLYMMGVGALVAVIGGIMFIWIAGRIAFAIKTTS